MDVLTRTYLSDNDVHITVVPARLPLSSNMSSVPNEAYLPYSQREAASGVGRLKWDAKVRMKQAKLRAAGENMDRQEVVEAIIAASVEAAQNGVMQRFDEIAKERGFHEGDVGE